MKVPIRITANGTEYWCSESKKTLFVPASVEPSFEVTEDPTSMLHKGETIKPLVETTFDLDEMNDEQLREFAEQNNIELPANIKKEDSIRKFIANQLSTADEE